jgi:uncharacterized membrane protein YfcA
VESFLIFLAVGFAAQLCDGALGMGYGIISSSVLVALGVPPATASATVHGAKLFTTAASAASHSVHRNVNWRLFFPLAIAGVLGGVAGVYLITSIEATVVKPWVLAYFAIMGLYILWRAFKNLAIRHVRSYWMGPLGLTGGFLDAVGGGGWGPTVTTTLLGAGLEPRQAIGTVNTAEFFVSAAVVAAFVYSLASGRWSEASEIMQHAAAVGGLVVGGLVALTFAGWTTKHVPTRPMSFAVGLLVVSLAAWQWAQIAGWL